MEARVIVVRVFQPSERMVSSCLKMSKAQDPQNRFRVSCWEHKESFFPFKNDDSLTMRLRLLITHASFLSQRIKCVSVWAGSWVYVCGCVHVWVTECQSVWECVAAYLREWVCVCKCVCVCALNNCMILQKQIFSRPKASLVRPQISKKPSKSEKQLYAPSHWTWAWNFKMTSWTCHARGFTISIFLSQIQILAMQ